MCNPLEIKTIIIIIIIILWRQTMDFGFLQSDWMLTSYDDITTKAISSLV